MKSYSKFLVLLLAIISCGYSSNNDNYSNNKINKHNVLNSNILDSIYKKNPNSEGYKFVLEFKNICEQLITSFNNVANGIESAEKEHKDVLNFTYWEDKNNVLKKLK